MAPFENVVHQMGFGLYHKFVLANAAGSAFAQSTAVMNLMFVIPIMACDMNLAEDEILWLGFVYSLGTAVGGYLLSCWADVTGRNSVIAASLITMFGAMFACGFSHGYVLTAILIVLLGAGVAANATTTKIFLAEIVPMEKRGYYLVIIDIFWSIGYFMSIGFSVLLTSASMDTREMDVRLTTWRLMFGIAGFPSIILSCASSLLQSSPRFKIAQKKPQEALGICKYIYSVNNSKHCESFPIREQDLQGMIEEIEFPASLLDPPHHESFLKQIKKMFFVTYRLTLKRFRKSFAILICIKLALFPEIITVNMWLTKMLYFVDSRNCTINALSLQYMELNSNGALCDINVGRNVYRDFSIIACGIVLGQFMLLFSIDRLGRKMLFMISGCLCEVSAIVLTYPVPIFYVRLIMSFLYMTCYSIIDSSINVILIEAFPTHIRGTSSGMVHYLPRLVNMFYKRFHNNVPCQYSFITHIFLILPATILGYFLPELRQRPMVE